MAIAKRWYYVIQGQQSGPVRTDEIENLNVTGAISSSTLVWAEGMSDWECAERHFSGFNQSGPPPINRRPEQFTDTVTRDSARAEGQGVRSASQASRADFASTYIGPDGLYIHSPGRDFGAAVSTCLNKYVGFSGRASRSEYWYFVLFAVLANMVASLIDSILFGTVYYTADYGPVSSLVWLGLLLPSMAVGWRRLHDINRSGWWVGGLFLAIPAITFVFPFLFPVLFLTENEDWIGLLLVVPGILLFIYLIVLFFFACTKGDLVPNRYG